MRYTLKKYNGEENTMSLAIPANEIINSLIKSGFEVKEFTKSKIVLIHPNQDEAIIEIE